MLWDECKICGKLDKTGHKCTPVETASTTIEQVAKLIHYPECWDIAAYPTLLSAIKEVHQGCIECKHKEP